MKKIFTAMLLAAAPLSIMPLCAATAQDIDAADAADGGDEATGEQLSAQEAYDGYVGCSAYHLALGKLRQLIGDDAVANDEAGGRFMAAAFLALPDKSEEEGAEDLRGLAQLLIDETETGDDEAKQDFAGLGQVCDVLEPTAQQLIDESEAVDEAGDDGADFTNAT